MLRRALSKEKMSLKSRDNLCGYFRAETTGKRKCAKKINMRTRKIWLGPAGERD